MRLKGGQTRLLRPRLIGYAGALVIMIGAFVWALEARPTLSLDVTKDRTLYRENIEGQIENMYSLKVINKTQQPHDYLITLGEGPYELHGAHQISLAAGEIVDIPVSVALVDDNVNAHEKLHFSVTDASDPARQVTAPSSFIAPRVR